MEDPNKIEQLVNKYISKRLKTGLNISYGMLFLQSCILLYVIWPPLLYPIYVLICIAVLFLYAHEDYKRGYIFEWMEWVEDKTLRNPDFQLGIIYGVLNSPTIAYDPVTGSCVTPSDMYGLSYEDFLREKFDGNKILMDIYR